MSIEEDFERAYRDSFRAWLRKYNPVDEDSEGGEDDKTWCDESTRPPQNAPKLKCYAVFIDDIVKHIYGDAGYVTEDAILTIFKDDQQVAVFREWDYYLVKEVPNDD